MKQKDKSRIGSGTAGPTARRSSKRDLLADAGLSAGASHLSERDVHFEPIVDAVRRSSNALNVLERNISARSRIPTVESSKELRARFALAIRRKNKHLRLIAPASPVDEVIPPRYQAKLARILKQTSPLSFICNAKSLCCRRKDGLAFTDCYAGPEKIMASTAGKGEGS